MLVEFVLFNRLISADGFNGRPLISFQRSPAAIFDLKSSRLILGEL